jgi:hypothetical protein
LLQVNRVDGSLLGCVNATTNTCPFVADRSAPGFAMDRCVDTTACPAFSTVPGSVNAAYTVPALAIGAAVPTAGLTLGTVQTCPDQDSLRFPIEVMFAEPTSPVCGSDSPVCTSVRAVQCLAVNSTCPANYNMRVFRNPGNAATVPALVECRQARASCDLTAAGMTVNDPNSAAYTIPVKTGDALDGCIITGSTACPAAYPFNMTTAGALVACGTSAPPPLPPPQPLVCNATTQIPRYTASGSIALCQPIADPCPNDFPITLRKDVSGNVGGCMALNSTCPANFDFPVYGTWTFPNAPTGLTLTNCWATGVVTSCAFIQIASGAEPAGIGGSYTVPIMSNATGTERTLGCVKTASTACPAAFPFAYLDMTAAGPGGSPAASRTLPLVNKCFPAGEVTACQAPAPPAATTLTFSKPAYNRTALAACIRGVFATSLPALPIPTCPTAYPTVVLNTLNPATATEAEVVGCWIAPSCADTPQPFTLQSTSGVAFCVPQVVGLQTCGGYPVTTYQSGAGLYSANGAILLGCAEAKACPTTFPVTLKNTATATDSERCLMGPLSVPCSAVANGGFPVTVTNGTGSVVSCLAGAATCTSSQVTLATSAVGGVQGCSDITTRCADTNFPFPLYDGQNKNAGKLVRCLPAQTGTDCNGAAFDTYNIEVPAMWSAA